MDKTATTVEPVRFSDRLINFIQRNRKALLILVISIAAAIIIAAIIVAIVDATRVKAIDTVEQYSEQYDSLRAKSSDANATKELDTLLKDVQTFATSHGGYAGARAETILAQIHGDRKEWKDAEAAWISAAQKIPQSYLAPVAYYNGASAAEEAGDTAKAIELYTRCVDTYGDNFPLAPRAYFSLGRLQEQEKNTAAALATYNKMVNKWPNESWTKLAHSRILVLSESAK